MWIKHIYEYSKLTEVSTVQKFLTVEDEVYNRKNVYHLISKSNVQKTHFAFSFCMTLFIQFFERNQLHPFIRLRIESTP